MVSCCGVCCCCPACRCMPEAAAASGCIAGRRRAAASRRRGRSGSCCEGRRSAVAGSMTAAQAAMAAGEGERGLGLLGVLAATCGAGRLATVSISLQCLYAFALRPIALVGIRSTPGSSCADRQQLAERCQCQQNQAAQSAHRPGAQSRRRHRPCGNSAAQFPTGAVARSQGLACSNVQTGCS